jgi:hypothetical protein
MWMIDEYKKNQELCIILKKQFDKDYDYLIRLWSCKCHTPTNAASASLG